MEVVANSYMPGDPRLIDQIVYELKSQGIFDQFRKECIADVDTKPAYQNLRQRVEGSVASFLEKQTWKPDMNKNQVREMLRKNIYESGFLETGVERIVDQVVNPKINNVFLPQVEEVVYRFLGIRKPNRFGSKTESLKIDVTQNDLLPTDLEAVSPESDHGDIKKEEPDNLNDSADADTNSKMDEDESPPFEPLDEQILLAPAEDNSVDSHMSGFSGIGSQGSNHSTDMKSIQMDLSNQDSQMSRNSSESRLSIVTSDENTKMDICEESESKFIKPQENSTKNEENKLEEHKKSSDSNSKNKIDDKKSKSSYKSRSDKDKRDDNKDRKSSTSSKDKEHKSRSSSSSKDKDRSRDRKDSRSSSSKNDKDKDKKEKTSKDKEKSSRDKSKSSTSSSKYTSSSSNRDKSTSSKKESSSSSSKDKDKNKSSSSSNHKDKPKSNHNDSKTREEKSKSSSDKYKKEDKSSYKSSSSSSSRKDKDKKRDSKKDSKDDHYSSKDKKSDRRSTDRDSNDGQSSKMSYSGSFAESNSSNSQKNTQESSGSRSGSGSGDSGNSDFVEGKPPLHLSESIEDTPSSPNSQVQKVKLYKPKFASNIHEARKLMKIRKQLAQLEKDSQLSLSRVDIDATSTPIHKSNNKNGNLDRKNKKTPPKVSKQEATKMEKKEVVVEEPLVLQTSVLSQASWDALEARLYEEMSNIDYNSYESPEDYDYDSNKHKKEEAKNTASTKKETDTEELNTASSTEQEITEELVECEVVNDVEPEISETVVGIEDEILMEETPNTVEEEICYEVEEFAKENKEEDLLMNDQDQIVTAFEQMGEEIIKNEEEFEICVQIPTSENEDISSIVDTKEDIEGDEAKNENQVVEMTAEKVVGEDVEELELVTENTKQSVENSVSITDEEPKIAEVDTSTRLNLVTSESAGQSKDSMSEKSEETIESPTKAAIKDVIIKTEEKCRYLEEADLTKLTHLTNLIRKFEDQLNKASNNKIKNNVNNGNNKKSTPGRVGRKRKLDQKDTDVKNNNNRKTTLEESFGMEATAKGVTEKTLVTSIDHNQMIVPLINLNITCNENYINKHSDICDNILKEKNVTIKSNGESKIDWLKEKKIESKINCQPKLNIELNQGNKQTKHTDSLNGLGCKQLVIRLVKSDNLIKSELQILNDSSKTCIKAESNPVVEENTCRYLEKTDSSKSNFITSLIKKYEEQLRLIIQNGVKNNVKNNKNFVVGMKRQLEEENNSDFTNNNKKAECEEEIEPKRRRTGNQVLTKNSKEKVCAGTDITPNESFSLPLSPAESDVSNDKKEDSPELPKVKRNSLNKNPLTAPSNKRYSSEDLYKPRPIFTTTRRSRNAKNQDN